MLQPSPVLSTQRSARSQREPVARTQPGSPFPVKSQDRSTDTNVKDVTKKKINARKKKSQDRTVSADLNAKDKSGKRKITARKKVIGDKTANVKTTDQKLTKRAEAGAKDHGDGSTHQSEDSEESSSECSEEIVVYETPENQSYERKVVIGNLSRVGFREPFWHDKIASYFVVLSYLITYDVVTNFFLFTHVFGTMFIVTYAFCMLLVGFPMCYLEMALGQYTSTGVYLVFDRMVPAFVGVGVSALLINALVASMHHTLFIDSISVIRETIQILTSQMPWHHCLSAFDTKYCHVWSRECSKLPKPDSIPSYPSNFMYGKGEEFQLSLKGDSCVRPSLRSIYTGVLDVAPKSDLEKLKTASLVNWANPAIHEFDTFQQFVYLSPTFVFYTILFIALMLFILSRSRRTVVAYLNISLMLTFCVLSFLLHGILTLFRPKFPNAVPATIPRLRAVKGVGPWLCAISLTLRSLKLGQGGLIFLGSQNGFHNNLILDCLLITLVMIFVPFFYSLFHIIAIDSYILESVEGDPNKMSSLSGLRRENTYHNPATIATILLSANHIFGEYEPVLAFWYAIIMLSTVMASKVVRYEVAISALTEIYATFTDETSRFTLSVVVVLFTTLMSLGLQYTNGYLRTAGLNFAVVPFTSGVVVLLELFVIGMFYGFRVVYSNTTLMVFGASKAEGKKIKLLINSVALVLWTAVIPIAVVVSCYKVQNAT
ncbi:hypothetical protein Y032_0211g2215 [Ancylostoma ceylanicum]|uniref:Sodium:neurotransmitter symporter family protein n=1 Tax=Ancylostoma ceylanicum TaxID=53326 RepID=A0A016SK74_9BILA|nr:hypothetical protein Y032_0211g2215 [Ancylostoma ceylanicum]